MISRRWKGVHLRIESRSECGGRRDEQKKERNGEPMRAVSVIGVESVAVFFWCFCQMTLYILDAVMITPITQFLSTFRLRCYLTETVMFF